MQVLNGIVKVWDLERENIDGRLCLGDSRKDEL